MASLRMCGILGLFLAAAAVPSCLALANTSSEQPGAQASAPVPTFAPGVTLKNQHVDLSSVPFDTVQVCWPVNTVIQTGANYSADLQAEASVLPALGWDISNGTLQLFTTDNISTNLPISAVISLPATKLSGIFVSSPLAEVTVGPGFSADSFLVAAPFSGGDISVLGIDTPDLTLLSSGIGTIVVNGSVVNASVVASGVASVYLVGLENLAQVNLAGSANLYVEPSSVNATILGQASGINSVFYTAGSCAVTTPFLFNAPCVSALILPAPELDPLWTCGISVTGNFSCPDGGTLLAELAASAGVLPLPASATFLPLPVPAAVASQITQAPPTVTAKPVPRPTPVPPARTPAAVVVRPTPTPAPTPVSTLPPVGIAAQPVGAAPILNPLATSVPGPNIVTRTGQGPQFAGASGTGTQVANAVSGPNIPNTASGTNTLSPFPDNGLFGQDPAGLNSNAAFGGSGRRLQQAVAASFAYSPGSELPINAAAPVTSAGPGETSIQNLPCFINALGGPGSLQIYPVTSQIYEAYSQDAGK